MMKPSMRKIMAGRNLSGLPTHWYRFYRLGKYWASSCGQSLSLYEQQHVGPVSLDVARVKLLCPKCRENLNNLLAVAEDYTLEDLLHGFE